LKGIEQLLGYLDLVANAFSGEAALRPLVPLIERSRADFTTALEATLSGYLAVATDAMRDVMEIEYLLLLFAIDHQKLDEWLAATSNELRRNFIPVLIRQRLNAAGEPPFRTSAESVDYRGHSETLHVTPRPQWPIRRGFSSDQGWSGDLGFWELFEHARRLNHAIKRFTKASSASPAVRKVVRARLKDFQDGWKRTQEMQAVFMALVEASITEEEPPANTSA
jgi:hypothetical protein